MASRRSDCNFHIVGPSDRLKRLAAGSVMGCSAAVVIVLCFVQMRYLKGRSVA